MCPRSRRSLSTFYSGEEAFFHSRKKTRKTARSKDASLFACGSDDCVTMYYSDWPSLMATVWQRTHFPVVGLYASPRASQFLQHVNEKLTLLQREPLTESGLSSSIVRESSPLSVNFFSSSF